MALQRASDPTSSYNLGLAARPRAAEPRPNLRMSTTKFDLQPTKIEKLIMDSIRTARLGLPDWGTIAKEQHIALDYLMSRVDWMRRVGMIK